MGLTKVFKECLLEKFSKVVFLKNDRGLKRFRDIKPEVLNQHVPRRRRDWMPFMPK